MSSIEHQDSNIKELVDVLVEKYIHMMDTFGYTLVSYNNNDTFTFLKIKRSKELFLNDETMRVVSGKEILYNSKAKKFIICEIMNSHYCE
jgi:hypothetical protein